MGAHITRLPGASRWFAGGLIAYDNRVKTQLLGIEPGLVHQYGAVSEEVARGMALGVCRLLDVHAAMAITGIAGPEGGSREKPVGFVWIGCALRTLVQTRSFHFHGDREEVRQAACIQALRLLRGHLASRPPPHPARTLQENPR